jgi:predicted O-methyltransferase YrrM
MFTILNPAIADYMEILARNTDDEVLLEMEELARKKSFPIIGRLCGIFLEQMALSVRARRIFEFGSGYGYSAYWFTRAVGTAGTVICTEGDDLNVQRAKGFLERADRWNRTQYHCGWAQDHFARTDGMFDVIYNDADKTGYPDIWSMARERIRPGGLYIADNSLWSGRVTSPTAEDESTRAIQNHNLQVSSDEEFSSFMYPVRDGVLVARRHSPENT